jgi:hypothetical protein
MAMLLLIFEKMELTEGMMLGGRKPATTTASVAVINAYSIRSWPESCFQKIRNKRISMAVSLLAGPNP